jgi:hypothetical protein
VVTSGPGGGEAAPALTFTVVTTQPVISTISPVNGFVNSSPFTLVVTGTGFLNPPDPSGASTILWNNSPVPTFFSSGTVLTATINPITIMTSAATYTVTVDNPQPPAGADLVSNSKPFTATNPAPLLTSLSPTITTVGGVTLTLTLNGSQFIDRNTTVLWAGTALSTTFINSTQLTATVDPAKLAAVGFFTVTVTTAGPGGGTATPLTFTVANKAPALTDASPSSVALSSPAFTLIVNGTDFVNGAVIQWNGTTLTPTTFVSATQLSASVAPVNFPAGGVYTVTVLNPSPPIGGIVSTNFVTVTVNNPQPALTGLLPSAAVQGTPAFTLTITGTAGSFVTGTVASWNGSNRTTVFVSATQIQMGVLASDLTTAAPASIIVTNPSPNDGASAPIMLPITSPTLSLLPSKGLTLAVSSSSVLTISISNAQAASRVITLTSSNTATANVATSVVLTANTSLIPISVTSGITGSAIITAQLPAALGGGVSNVVTITVNFIGGSAPRFRPGRQLGQSNRAGPYAAAGGVALLALLPVSEALKRPGRGRARAKRRTRK